jgi:predicted nucleic acid-binding Zn ribbon protein
LLVLAKHSKLNVGIKKYYANAKWTEIFTTAKVHVNLDEQYRILNLLGQKTKLILMKLSGTNKLSSFLITFIDEQSEPLFYIDDFENITKFYPHYCSVCGKQIVKRGNNHNMCNECWKNKYKELNKERMRKTRLKI